MIVRTLVLAVAVSIPTLAFAEPATSTAKKLPKLMAAHAEWTQGAPARNAVFGGDANSMYGWNSPAINDAGRCGGGDGGSSS